MIIDIVVEDLLGFNAQKLNWHIKIMLTLTGPNRIGGVMISVISSSVVDRGFETMKLVCVASLLSTQH